MWYSVSFTIRKCLNKSCFLISRGSPMVIGVKCADHLAANHVPVMFSKGKYLYKFYSLFEKQSLSIIKIIK